MGIFLGVDISKKKFDVALLQEGKFKTKVFMNTTEGYSNLLDWLAKKNIDQVHVCMEATGSYYEGLAYFLEDRDYQVSVANPLKIKSFGQSKLKRTKTDKSDARLIAQYCEAMKPALWQPDSPEIRHLKALGRRRDALIDMQTQEINRNISSDDDVKASGINVLKFLDQEIQGLNEKIKNHINDTSSLKKMADLLRTIPGVGDITIEVILSETNGFKNFKNVKQVIAYIGLSPKEHSSGSSVNGKQSMCKIGNRRLRKILYMPAIVAMRCNQVVKELAERLKEKSKHGKVIACACMKKLVQIMFGVIKSNMPFDPEYHLNSQQA